MLCSNCGKNEANVRYTHIVNGKKTELSLCEDCAKKMGLEDIDFNMPINFSNFLSEFFEDDTLIPNFTNTIDKCPKCGLTYNDFAKNGKFGCSQCYESFSNKLDTILKNLHGTAKHVGRRPKNIIKKLDNKSENKKDKEQTNEKQNRINDLNNDLQLAIKEERYEEAAKIRDEIKKLQ